MQLHLHTRTKIIQTKIIHTKGKSEETAIEPLTVKVLNIDHFTTEQHFARKLKP